MTLTQVATWTKRGILISVILTVLGISGAIAYSAWHQYYLANLPPVEEKPEMRFGSLSKLSFPPATVSSSNFAYSLDTVTGGFPQFPKLLKVYFLPRTPISLMTSDKTKSLAQNLGFPNGPETLSPQEYKFTDNDGGELKIDITTGNFHFKRQDLTDPPKESGDEDLTEINENSLPKKDQLIKNLTSYLISKNLLVDELKSGRTNVVLNGSDTNPETADISIWPADFDNLPIVTADLRHGLVRATVNKNSPNQFSNMDYTVWPIDKTTSSTYPIKTPEQAFSDLKSGQGFISLEPSTPKVSISSIYMAYFESAEYSPYLQPVYIFEGPEFAAIVPAIAE